MTTEHTTSLAASLARGLDAMQLSLPPSASEQLLRYLDLIARWNKVYNLTAVRDPQDMLTQHLLDCLAIVQSLRRATESLQAPSTEQGGNKLSPVTITTTPANPPLRVLDVGSGAGLPGVVLAIAQPSWQITCVDTVAKKASFIRQVSAELGLSNLTATHQRVEAMPAANFQLITCRAFASLADFITLSVERLAPGGCWVAMKARLTSEEQAAVPPIAEVFHVEPLAVPGLDAERCLVWMRRRT